MDFNNDYESASGDEESNMDSGDEFATMMMMTMMMPNQQVSQTDQRCLMPESSSQVATQKLPQIMFGTDGKPYRIGVDVPPIDDVDKMLLHPDFPRMLILTTKVKELRNTLVSPPAKQTLPTSIISTQEIKAVWVRMLERKVKLPKHLWQGFTYGTCPTTDVTIRHAINALEDEYVASYKFLKKRLALRAKFQKEHPQRKRKGNGIASKYSKFQCDILFGWIIGNLDDPFPKPGDIAELMAATGLDYNQVQNWATNIRKRNLKGTIFGKKKPHHFIDFLFKLEYKLLQEGKRNDKQTVLLELLRKGYVNCDTAALGEDVKQAASKPPKKLANPKQTPVSVAKAKQSNTKGCSVVPNVHQAMAAATTGNTVDMIAMPESNVVSGSVLSNDLTQTNNCKLKEKEEDKDHEEEDVYEPLPPFYNQDEDGEQLMREFAAYWFSTLDDDGHQEASIVDQVFIANQAVEVKRSEDRKRSRRCYHDHDLDYLDLDEDVTDWAARLGLSFDLEVLHPSSRFPPRQALS